MYKILFFFVAILISLNVFATDLFCKGFEKGYTTRYKKAKNSAFEPFFPLQPFKKFGDPESDFEQGYIIGSEKGMEKGSE